MSTIFDPSFYERLSQLPNFTGEPIKHNVPKITGEIMLPSVVDNPENS